MPLVRPELGGSGLENQKTTWNQIRQNETAGYVAFGTKSDLITAELKHLQEKVMTVETK